MTTHGALFSTPTLAQVEAATREQLLRWFIGCEFDGLQPIGAPAPPSPRQIELQATLDRICERLRDTASAA